jgi:ribonuclease P protein component
MSLLPVNLSHDMNMQPHANNFARSKRLTEAVQFKRVFESNSRVGDRYWTILYRTNDADTARLGMAVAKKRVRRSVDRSRLKRLVRESFRLSKLPCVDIVVMPKGQCTTASSSDLTRSLNKQWSRIAKQCAA